MANPKSTMLSSRPWPPKEATFCEGQSTHKASWYREQTACLQQRGSPFLPSRGAQLASSRMHATQSIAEQSAAWKNWCSHILASLLCGCSGQPALHHQHRETRALMLQSPTLNPKAKKPKQALKPYTISKTLNPNPKP